MSLLLREKKQREDGRFIISTKGVKLAYGASAPGTIRYFGEDGKLDHVETFSPGGTFVETSKMPNLSKNCRPGERVTSLGVNVYKNTGPSSLPILCVIARCDWLRSGHPRGCWVCGAVAQSAGNADGEGELGGVGAPAPLPPHLIGVRST